MAKGGGSASKGKNKSGRVSRLLALGRVARAVEGRTGKSVAAQLSEVIRLRLGPGRMSPSMYYEYGLYDDQRYPWELKREFVSWDVLQLGGRVNDRAWRGIVEDKLAFYAYLRGNGIRYPEVVAYYHPGGRHVGVAPCLRTTDEVCQHLRSGMPYPFFGKPSSSSKGQGASLVEGYDAATDRLRMANGDMMEVERYVREIVGPRAGSHAIGSRYGYIFQQVLRQAPALEPTIGKYVSTLRVQVLVHDDGPRVHRVIWRVSVAGNITDNFRGGSAGNLLAAVDRDSGVVRRVLAGRGRTTASSDSGSPGQEVEQHPDTGAQLVGMRLPAWDDAMSLALTAARAFPRVRFQSWDIALADGGPSVVELNYYGDFLQYGQDRGINDPDLQAFLAKYGA